LAAYFILEGQPCAGKTEISNLLKVFLPEQVRVLPELVTDLVRRDRISLLTERERLTQALVRELPVRAGQVRDALAEGKSVLEESHMGVHWAYSKALGDAGFLAAYERFEASLQVPDAYLRLAISPSLSTVRQRARATPDVQVDALLISDMGRWLDVWHRERARAPLVRIDADRSPERVVADVLSAMGVQYRTVDGG
jgi:thymidylate kinase